MDTYRQVEILLLEDNPRDVVESYRLGVNSYVVKPVQFEGLADIVTGLGLYWLLTNRLPQAGA